MATTMENRPRVSALGKELRIMRMDRGELLKDMAAKIGVTSAYLSAVENGNKKPTHELVEKICYAYGLDEIQAQTLEDAYLLSMKVIPIELYDASDEQQQLGLKLARTFSSLSPSQIRKITDALNDQK